ncbi:hypothetical protein EDB81DRAFT_784654 [Dactylonectria macrodidyma]|uniref:Uncharacterized protein n=1 Tax=Dactylonectria macrodidyma TaxID=307937 RepID=A0A9P9FH56_9HYPO|nr:hypothetical protein EDB81DRAFT_784654 [Dactylonectria macrodidyma]
MNSPPANGGSPQGNPQVYRHSIDEWRQSALAHRDQYVEHVKAQINRSFQEYSPPFYASLLGYGRDKNLLVVTSRVSGFASSLGRDLEDSEAKAIAEYSLELIHSSAAAKWATIGLAAFMTYRGRRTWQFPFYKPKLGGRFNPNEATSIFTNKKIRGAYPRLTWHTLRFTAYVGVTMLMVEPVFRAVNLIQSQSAMSRDPRLSQLMQEASSRVEKIMVEGPAGLRQANSEPKPWGSESTPRNDDQVEGFNDADKEAAAPATAWNRGRIWTDVPRDVSSSQEQQSSDGWSALGDDDDASPLANSAKNQQTPTTTGGSSWDRLRRQAQSGQQPQQQASSQAQGSWADAGRPQSQSGSGWGDNTSTGSDWGGSKDSYSYGSADDERKGQAQREFDQMLERERRSSDHDQKWGGR